MMVIKMAFKPWRKKRKQGEKFPEGFIKRRIALMISNHFPEGISEPDLREALREEWGISEAKGVKLHLGDLEKKRVLTKEEKKGFANIWKLNPDYEALKFLVKEFYKAKYDEWEKDINEFIKSKYAQSIINENFVDHFAVGWGKRYAEHLLKKPYVSNGMLWGKRIDEFTEDDFRSGFFDNLVSLSKNNLIEILRLSPTALKTFLFPEEVRFLETVSLGDHFLFPFVFDMLTYGIAPDKGIEVKLETTYGDLVTKDGNILISPTLRGKSEFKIFTVSKTPIISPTARLYLKHKREEKHADNP